MEPISTVLTGLALAKQGIEFIKSNLDTINDAKAIGEQLSNVFAGHQEFQRKRFSGGVKDVAMEMIELKLQEEQLRELSFQIDMRFGNGFFQTIKDEYNRRVKEEKEQQRVAKIQRRKQVEHLTIGGLLLATFAVIGIILWFGVRKYLRG